MKRKGFTLIELLVVIAIIAILAAILFPVFARARENARRSACQSNMKQIGLGLLQYSQDYDEKFPIGLQGNVGGNGTGGGAGWAGQIFPYLKSDQIFKCPSDSPLYNGANKANQSNLSYALNANLSTEYGDWVTASKVTGLADLSSSSKTVMAWEAFIGVPNGKPALVYNISAGEVGGTPYTDSGSGTAYSMVSAGSTPGGNWTYGMSGAGCNSDFLVGMAGPMGGRTNNYSFSACGGIAPPPGRHLEGGNFLACDGHVKWLKGDSVSSGLNAANETSAQGGGGGNKPGSRAAGTADTTYALTYSRT